MTDQHPFSCICDLCAPISALAPSPMVKPTPVPVTDVELAQMVALFKQLDERGRALVFAMTQAAARLSGARG